MSGWVEVKKKRENRIKILKQTILHATIKIVVILLTYRKQTAFLKCYLA